MKRTIINVEWVETLPSGKKTTKYENFLTDTFIEDFVNGLKERGCTNIQITEVEMD